MRKGVAARRNNYLSVIFGVWLGSTLLGLGQEADITQRSSIWVGDVPGSGFAPGTHTIALEAGANYGIACFGGQQQHHLALGSISYGSMLGNVTGEGHWYRGNFELRGELFGGMEFSPDDEWLIGLTPHLRYNFATGSRWIPFFDLGAGVTATGIGPPDLSGTFEFNLQATMGVHWFVRDDLAITADVRYLHISCGGIHDPNLGLNGVTGMLGVTKFF